ncbi:MAG: hypothetical protein M3552_21270, partial [Planctomycetota bacterium]|nr:hypothetical protein [Planctomycetota bacterium]
EYAAACEYPAAFEKFFNDAFGFRKTLTSWHHLAAMRCFGLSPSDKVAVGKEGWLFLELSIADYRGDRHFTEQDLELRTRVLQERHDWLAARGIRYLIVLVPNKPTVYPDKVADHVVRQFKTDNVRLLEEYATKHSSVEILDLTDCLVEASRTHETYPATDCHWNDYGAYVGYRATIDRLAGWYPHLTPTAFEDLTPTEVPHGGDLGYMIGLFDELQVPRTLLRPKQPRFTLVERIHEPYPYYSEITKVDDPSLPTAVVFHDSFMTNQREFLSENFQLTKYLRIETGFDPQVVLEYRPQVVIQEVVERMLPNLVTNPPALRTPSPSSPPVRERLATGPDTKQVQ